METCKSAHDFGGSHRKLAVLGDFQTPLLRWLNRRTMGTSVEMRVPFLDHRRVHKAINLLLDYKQGPARGLAHTMQSWQRKVQCVFGLIALEIWGRIHMLGQPVAELERLVERCEQG